MGLGPPVCTDCRVIHNFNNTTKEWTCPGCGSKNTSWFLFNQQDQTMYEQNTKFLKFLKGESNGNS